MIKYTVCTRMTELKTNGRFSSGELKYDSVSDMIRKHYNNATDCSPDTEKAFLTLQSAMEELDKIELSARFGCYGGFEYYTVMEKWLDISCYDNDGDLIECDEMNFYSHF